jgi:hypothetical protein
MSMPVLPYIVVDQNALRHESLVLPAITRAREIGGAILLPDVALVEMTKGANWEYATRRSLEILSRFPTNVAVAHNVGELLRRERAAGRPLPDLVDEELLPSFRAMLCELHDGAGPNLDHFLAAIPMHQSMARAQHLNHTKNKASVEKFVVLWSDVLGPDGVRAATQADIDGIRAVLSGEPFARLMTLWLKQADYPAEDAALLANGRSVTAHLLLLQAALAFRWLVQRGLPNMAPEKVTNELADMEYVLLASFCDGLVTQEGRMGEFRALLEDVSAMRAAMQSPNS